MKTCDICGTTTGIYTDVHEYLQKEGVKTLCYDCAEIVNKFSNRVHEFAEKEAKKAQAAMLDRLNEVQREKVRVKTFFFLLNLRGIFKKRVVHAAFDVGKVVAEP